MDIDSGYGMSFYEFEYVIQRTIAFFDSWGKILGKNLINSCLFYIDKDERYFEFYLCYEHKKDKDPLVFCIPLMYIWYEYEDTLESSTGGTGILGYRFKMESVENNNRYSTYVRLFDDIFNNGDDRKEMVYEDTQYILDYFRELIKRYNLKTLDRISLFGMRDWGIYNFSHLTREYFPIFREMYEESKYKDDKEKMIKKR